MASTIASPIDRVASTVSPPPSVPAASTPSVEDKEGVAAAHAFAPAMAATSGGPVSNAAFVSMNLVDE